MIYRHCQHLVLIFVLSLSLSLSYRGQLVGISPTPISVHYYVGFSFEFSIGLSVLSFICFHLFFFLLFLYTGIVWLHFPIFLYASICTFPLFSCCVYDCLTLDFCLQCTIELLYWVGCNSPPVRTRVSRWSW